LLRRDEEGTRTGEEEVERCGRLEGLWRREESFMNSAELL
jgi:hypothetical protein